MPKEYRYEGCGHVFAVRPAPCHGGTLGPLMERDVSEWRASPPESDALSELRHLRTLSKTSLEFAIGEELTHLDNPYEMDTAILFYLIRKHSTGKVQAAVREILGVDSLPKQGAQ